MAARELKVAQRVRYSSEGARVLCREGDRFASDPDRVGVFLGMVTQRVGRVLWDDRRSPQFLHIDYLAAIRTQPTPISTNSLPATASPDAVHPLTQEPGNSAGASVASAISIPELAAPPPPAGTAAPTAAQAGTVSPAVPAASSPVRPCP